MARKAVFHDTGTFDDGSPLDIPAASGLTAHLADTSDAHDASAISIVDTGGYFTATDVEAALQELGAGGGGGSVATDAIWDAAGDLAVGSGANTAAKLALGASGKALMSNGSTAVWDWPPGHEFDYVAQTSTQNVTATAWASANTIVTGNAVSYDGSTIILIEFQAYSVLAPADGFIQLGLFDGSTHIAILSDLSVVASTTVTASPDAVQRLAIRLTPTNASHTYSIRGIVNAGTGQVLAGTGTSGANAPAFIRQIKV